MSRRPGLALAGAYGGETRVTENGTPSTRGVTTIRHFVFLTLNARKRPRSTNIVPVTSAAVRIVAFGTVRGARAFHRSRPQGSQRQYYALGSLNSGRGETGAGRDPVANDAFPGWAFERKYGNLGEHDFARSAGISPRFLINWINLPSSPRRNWFRRRGRLDSSRSSNAPSGQPSSTPFSKCHRRCSRVGRHSATSFPQPCCSGSAPM